jgi:hypothetical protein
VWARVSTSSIETREVWSVSPSTRTDMIGELVVAVVLGRNDLGSGQEPKLLSKVR